MSEELARHGYRISPGTLYPTLHRMEAEGLLSSRDELVEGRRRRRYRATRQGKRVLAQTKRGARRVGGGGAAGPPRRGRGGGASGPTKGWSEGEAVPRSGRVLVLAPGARLLAPGLR